MVHFVRVKNIKIIDKVKFKIEYFRQNYQYYNFTILYLKNYIILADKNYIDVNYTVLEILSQCKFYFALAQTWLNN